MRALCAAQFGVVLSFQGAAITIPIMQQAFGATPVVGQWLITANALAFGGLLLLTGRAGDVFGHRRLFLSGLAMFAGSSCLAGLAPSIGWLIVARIAQGVGLAMFVPACLALLIATYPEGVTRHRAMAVWGISGPLGGIAALLCSGFLLESFSWRALYLLMPVAALVPAALSRIVFPHDPSRGAAALDSGNALLGTAGIGLLLLGLDEAVQAGLTVRALVSILLGRLLMGYGLGWVQVGIVGTAAESVSAAEQGITAGLVNTGAQVGTAAGLVMLIALFTTIGSRAGDTVGYSAAFLGAAGFALRGLMAALVACRIQRDGRVVRETAPGSPQVWEGVAEARG